MMNNLNEFGLNTTDLVKSMSRQSKLQASEVKLENSLIKPLKLKK